MPAEAENYRLLFAIISQMEVKNIDWSRVAVDIGVPTKQAAQKRWQRLKDKEGCSPADTSPKKRSHESDDERPKKKSPVKRKTKGMKKGSNGEEIEVKPEADEDQVK